MVRLANYSGSDVIRILQKHFGFQVISQKGSHVKLRKVFNNQTIMVIVPDHTELAPGTLRNILRQAQIDINQFFAVR